MKKISGLFLVCAVLLSVSSLFAAEPRKILLVDDDFGGFMEKAWKDNLGGFSGTVDTVEAHLNFPTLELMSKYNLVIWVTGGRHGDLSNEDINLIKKFIDARGNLLLAGENTGDALHWSWVDGWYFGFDFLGNTFSHAKLTLNNSFAAFEAPTDYGTIKPGARSLVTVFDPQNQGMPGKVAGTVGTRYPARTAWMGFNLSDVWNFGSQREIVRAYLWELNCTFSELVNEYQTLATKLQAIDDSGRSTRASSDQTESLFAEAKQLHACILNRWKQMLRCPDLSVAEKTLEGMKALQNIPEMSALNRELLQILRHPVLHRDGFLSDSVKKLLQDLEK